MQTPEGIPIWVIEQLASWIVSISIVVNHIYVFCIVQEAVIRTDILLADELFVDDGEPELGEFRTDPVEVVVVLADALTQTFR